jgi:hypothetical protein
MRLKETPHKPIPTLKSNDISCQRRDGSGYESSYQERQRRLGKKLPNIHARLAHRSPSDKHTAKLVLCQEEQRCGKRIAHPCGADRRRNIHPSHIRDQSRRQHLERQRHHRAKDPNGTPRSEARAVGLPHFVRKESLSQLSVQPRTSQMFDPGKVPQIRSGGTPAPLTRLHPSERRSAIFPRISACQGSLSCLNTLLYEEN